MENRCKHCKSTFEKTRKDKVYCSRDCKSNARKMRKYNSSWKRLKDVTQEEAERINKILEEKRARRKRINGKIVKID